MNIVFSTEFQDSSGGKRYKFVVTGHGKYEKVSVDDGCSEDANCQSGKTLKHPSFCAVMSRINKMFTFCLSGLLEMICFIEN